MQHVNMMVMQHGHVDDMDRCVTCSMHLSQHLLQSYETCGEQNMSR